MRATSSLVCNCKSRLRSYARAKGRRFRYLVVAVNVIEAASILAIREGWLGATGVHTDGGKAFPSSGEEQEASSELPLYPRQSSSLVFPVFLPVSYSSCLSSLFSACSSSSSCFSSTSFRFSLHLRISTNPRNGFSRRKRGAAFLTSFHHLPSPALFRLFLSHTSLSLLSLRLRVTNIYIATNADCG